MHSDSLEMLCTPKHPLLQKKAATTEIAQNIERYLQAREYTPEQKNLSFLAQYCKKNGLAY